MTCVLIKGGQDAATHTHRERDDHAKTEEERRGGSAHTQSPAVHAQDRRRLASRHAALAYFQIASVEREKKKAQIFPQVCLAPCPPESGSS